MNLLCSIIIHTANVLGVFYDPFEFAGDYGDENNSARKKVFEQVVSKEALAKNLSDAEILHRIGKEHADDSELADYRSIFISQALEQDRQHGPLLSEVATPEILSQLTEIQLVMADVGFTVIDLQQLRAFVERNGRRKIFYFLRNHPADLIKLDKVLRDHAINEDRPFDWQILSSSQPFEGENAADLKINLLKALFKPEVFQLTKPAFSIKKALEELPEEYFQQYFGPGANNNELDAFCSPAGQIFFFWLYQALNLELVSSEQGLIAQINQVKRNFSETLGNAHFRAEAFREKLIAAGSGIVFTQESDQLVRESLLRDGLFHTVEKQNPKDGTYIFLRSDLWKPDYQIIPMDNYEGYSRGLLNVILASKSDTGEKFLLASCHGNSMRPEDGRLQITLVMEKFNELAQRPGNDGLQLLIGIDANTKSEKDVSDLRQHLDALGLVGTEAGPTTIKKRMVTVQHAKAGKFAVDEEDYLIILKPEQGGRYRLSNTTVGFSVDKPDVSITLPNMQNLSDHYPVGAELSLY